MAESHISIRLQNGPSKMDLMVALFHSPNNGEKDHLVTFVTVGGREVKVSLRGAVMLDGSRENWLIQGYEVGSGKELKIRFDTRTRLGNYATVEPTSPTPHRYNYVSSLQPSSDPKPDPHLKPLIERKPDQLINKNELLIEAPIINKSFPLK